jgi:hypothetical protein
MDELSKIQYSIGELLKKKQEDHLAQSIEVRFAETLNQLSTGNPIPENEAKPQNALLGKLGRHLGAVAHERVD